ncbi:MAG TPA: homoserine dehydrogenase, partial [Thermoanaerobaculia bacterium]|nr:homoserine dehydrogenase [Thermoanaerobaculia bacterium]
MSSAHSVRLALLGFGTVGRSFLRLALAQRERFRDDFGIDLSISVVASRGGAKKREAWVPESIPFTDDLEAAAVSPDVDLVVELIGGEEPARSLLSRAIAAGKSVVTANKLLLARHGSALAVAAREKGVGLGIEAAVAGGIPILRAVRESFASDRIVAVAGILNGTCNFILTEMEKAGRAYADVLAEAQRLGFAEADPGSDVEGNDAAYKLALLARMAFGQDVPVDAIHREGITRLLPCDFVYAEELSRTPRQIARAAVLPSGNLALSVRTHLVSKESLLSKITGPYNAVQVSLERGGDFVFSGRGAGGDPTATAVLADVVDLARSGPKPLVPPLGYSAFAPLREAGPAEFVAPFYVRFVVRDRPGILAEIARAFADEAINVDA